ncbi:PREDICTED: arylacetamide deacetylase-like 2-like [Chrysochloris asiatica]|uniref:Arylacetamide deacetylase-like 2-like n=1 Tax=Chrysochloris asiatica TaxID=185453 RepID=A0A9B0WTA4_CHRAS|nr:PREDICTED: arylacetamide deacetylase-like 2-like [Chrysochloris asiatica]
MEWKVLCVGLTFVLFAYFIYTPMPENIEEPWKVRIMDAVVKCTSFVAKLLENIGIMRYEEFFTMLMELDYSQPISDENITVTDTTFSDIPVRLYLPKRKSERKRRAVIFIHGGAFVLGSFKQLSYDFLNRQTANKLDAVVVGADYRLAPQYQFPVALDDVFAVVKHFLQDKILEKYGVDPTRICISGDSCGGLLATKVIQLMQNNPEFKDKIKAQALLYPHLQIIDTSTPSYQENKYGPILSKDLGIQLECLYLTTDKRCIEAVEANQHMPEESRHLFKFVNWSIFLPEKFKKNHVYSEPILGRYDFRNPALMDSRLSPLLVSDIELQKLPLTYILTCQYDILRDDGLMYVTRLRNVGVQVTHDHIENGFHGALAYMGSMVHLRIGIRLKDKYISWLDENL